jgi:hypothetical protein
MLEEGTRMAFGAFLNLAAPLLNETCGSCVLPVSAMDEFMPVKYS